MPTPVRAATPKPLKTKPRKGSYKVTKPTSVALRLVRPWIVDRVVRWARRNNDICNEVNRALTEVFGTPPKDGWRDSDGYDCNGRDVDGFDVDGYDNYGFDRDGYNVNGWNRYGWNRSGTNLWGIARNSFDAEQLLKHVNPAAQKALYELLKGTDVAQPAE